MQKPRLPNQHEITELQNLLLADLSKQILEVEASEMENVLRLIDSASVAIFDNYAADTPPEPPLYAGKLMSVVWSSSPGDHDVFVWQSGQLQPVCPQLQE